MQHSWASNSAFSSYYVRILLVKTDRSGNFLWKWSTIRESAAFMKSVIELGDGSYLIFGLTQGTYGWGDVEFIRINNEGKLLWNQTWGYNHFSNYSPLIQTSDGGALIAGYFSQDNNIDDFSLIKFDNTGEFQWKKLVNGIKNKPSRVTAVIETKDGGYFLAGRFFDTNSSDHFPVFFKLDSNGVVQWNQTLGEGDQVESVIETVDGYAFAGWTDSYEAIDDDYWLMKMDTNGQAEWNQTFGGRTDDLVSSLIQTADGGFLLAGTSYDTEEYTSKIWIVKTDKKGNEEWNQTYAGLGYDSILIDTSDNSYTLIGTTNPYISSVESFNMLLIKIDNIGTEQWNQTYGTTSSDSVSQTHAKDGILTSDGGYLLLGTEMGFDPFLLSSPSTLPQTHPTPSSAISRLLIFLFFIVLIALTIEFNRRVRNRNEDR